MRRLAIGAAAVITVLAMSGIYRLAVGHAEARELKDRAAELESDPMVAVIKSFLEQEPTLGRGIAPGTVGLCGFRALGAKSAGNSLEAYLWVHCAEFVRSGTEIQEISGFALPVALTLTEGRVTSHRMPGDGAAYSAGIRAIFPKALHRTILSQEFDAPVLPAPPEEQAEQALAPFDSEA